jgi:hypothetical protein
MTAFGGTGVDATGRSTGKRKTHRHAKISGQFAPRLVEMLRSPAYRILSVSALGGFAARVGIQGAMKAERDGGTDIPFKYRVPSRKPSLSDVR